MNENIKVKNFLAELRKFLPEKTIYLALSSLPEDIFDNEEYTCVPSFENDKEVQEFIEANGFEVPENIISFFMKPYFDHIEEMLNNMLGDVETTEHCEAQIESVTFNNEYMSIYG